MFPTPINFFLAPNKFLFTPNNFFYPKNEFLSNPKKLFFITKYCDNIAKIFLQDKFYTIKFYFAEAQT